MYKRILIATDGSPLSDKAVESGLSLAALSVSFPRIPPDAALLSVPFFMVPPPIPQLRMEVMGRCKPMLDGQ